MGAGGGQQLAYDRRHSGQLGVDAVQPRPKRYVVASGRTKRLERPGYGNNSFIHTRTHRASTTYRQRADGTSSFAASSCHSLTIRWDAVFSLCVCVYGVCDSSRWAMAA